MDNIYYNYDKILSYNALLNFIIGERGVGKSYGAKLYVAKNFIKFEKTKFSKYFNETKCRYIF